MSHYLKFMVLHKPRHDISVKPPSPALQVQGVLWKGMIWAQQEHLSPDLGPEADVR